MKHRHRNRILGRTASARNQLLKQLAGELIRRRSLTTTVAKAKEVRGFVEPLITQAKGEFTLHQRRQVRRRLLTDTDLALLRTLALDHASRAGGYTRITRVSRRAADGAQIVRLDIVEPVTAK